MNACVCVCVCVCVHRGYAQSKVEENVQCEIFQTLVEEARDSYREEIVVVLQNDTEEDLERNVDTIVQGILHLQQQRQQQEEEQGQRE